MAMKPYCLGIANDKRNTFCEGKKLVEDSLLPLCITGRLLGEIRSTSRRVSVSMIPAVRVLCVCWVGSLCLSQRPLFQFI